MPDIIQALIELNNPTYIPERWHATLIVMLTVLILSSCNITVAGRLSISEGIFAICHIFAFVPLAVTLWVMGPTNDASAVFLRFTDNGGGWPSLNLSVLVGQVSCIFATLGSDSVSHISGDVEDAAQIVPKSMVWSYLLNLPLSFIFILTWSFNIDSITSVIHTTYPFVWTLQHALQNVSSTTVFMSIVLVLLAMITLSAIASTSRQAFATAKDNGLPFSGWIKHLSRKVKVPYNAISLTAGFTMAASLLNIGSTTAFNTLLSLSSSALLASYIISIGCILRKRVAREPMPEACWTLGKHGLWTNCVALAYASWAFFWCFWPPYYEVTASNFNWAPVLFVGLAVLACVLYTFQRKPRYEAPVRVEWWMDDR